jgi:Zn-dependent protease with chaperone function
MPSRLGHSANGDTAGMLTLLLIIVVLVLLFGGGGYAYRGRRR